jgi:hypothetical protein
MSNDKIDWAKASTVVSDVYLKHDIYCNELFDLVRLALITMDGATQQMANSQSSSVMVLRDIVRSLNMDIPSYDNYIKDEEKEKKEQDVADSPWLM